VDVTRSRDYKAADTQFDTLFNFLGTYTCNTAATDCAYSQV